MPGLLLGLGRAISRVQRGLPLAEVLFLGQLAFGAQAVEHCGIGRALIEEAAVEVPQRTIGGVVECELLVGGEDRDAGGELVEGAAMGVVEAAERAPHRLDFGGVDADAGAALACRHVEHVEAAPRAGDDRGCPRHVVLAGGAGTACLVARHAGEEFERARHGVGRVLGLDRARVGRIDEGQGACDVAGPNRLGHARRSACGASCSRPTASRAEH